MICRECSRPTANYTARTCRKCMHRPTAVREAMTRRGIGVGQLAARTGLSVTTIKRAAAGCPLGRRVACVLARELGLDAGALVLGEQAA